MKMGERRVREMRDREGERGRERGEATSILVINSATTRRFHRPLRNTNYAIMLNSAA